MSTVDHTSAALDEAAAPPSEPEPAVREALAHVLAVARLLVPEAVDGVSYGVPALIVDGKALIGVSRSARHLSVVPYSPSALDTVRGDLTDFSVSKGLIRFTPDRPVPDGILTRLVLARLAEIRR
jgi:uncharacterized protein YdhG (YjbR/CyaY superfamily)